MSDDRAARPEGILAALSDLWAHLRADPPRLDRAAPVLVADPLRELEPFGLLDEIHKAPYKLVGPANPPVKSASGYEYRSIHLTAWAEDAGLGMDEAALAWCLASEAPDIRKFPAYAVAIAEAVTNAARHDGSLVPGYVAHRVCSDRRFQDRYFLGRQGGRWCSSFQQPTQQHVRCAGLVIDRAIIRRPNILARGATQWLDAHVQVAMNAKKSATNPTPEAVMARRYKSGQKWVGPIVGEDGRAIIDPWRLTLLGPVGVDEAEAMEMLKDGRKRWRR